jgi:tetratricopeptide (TPR) repeat protein
MRKTTLITTGVCILSALLLFAAPAFRQAFRLSLAPWHWVFYSRPSDGQSSLRALARRAEQKRDAEALAFCAIRMADPRESARMAEEAVRLDPNLTWVYAVVAVRHCGLAEISQWVPKLEQYDPQNALPYLITAESSDILHVNHEDFASHGHAKDPVWQSAMAAAFQSPKCDNYEDRLEALDAKVLPRYGLYDPKLVWMGSGGSVPSYTFENSELYAKSLLRSGLNLEAKGDTKDAIELYWSVARYGQMMYSQTHDFDYLGTTLQGMAYRRLQVVFEKGGYHSEAAHFASLITLFDSRRAQQEWLRRYGGGQDVARWNALEVTASGLMMLIFAGLVAVAGSILVLRRHRTGPTDLRAQRVAAQLALTGAVGLFLSSVMLYVTYYPYTEIFDRILKGDRSRIGDLQVFLGYSHELPFSSGPDWSNPFYYSLNFVFYFWLAVIVFGLMGLLFVAARRFRNHPRASVPA